VVLQSCTSLPHDWIGSDSTEQKANRVRFEKLAVTRINITVFWDVGLCSIADSYEHLEKRLYLGLSTALYSFWSQTAVKF